MLSSNPGATEDTGPKDMVAVLAHPDLAGLRSARQHQGQEREENS